MLVPLDAAEPTWLGGKGAGLQRLLRVGLPVPRAWVVPPHAFRAFLDANGLLPLAEQGRDAELYGAIPRAPIPFALEAPAPRLAVRSSALDEDGAERSAAGQYETVLDVTPDGLADAVRRCWASHHAPRAAAYRHGACSPGRDGAAGGSTAPGGMAVVLMEMLDPRASGVLFTTNPLTGSWREMVAEAVWGLGEPLVSGRMVPDRYVLARPRLPARLAAVAARWSGVQLIDETIAPQHVELRPSRGGPSDPRWAGGTVESPTEAPYARKLGKPDLDALARLGLAAEAALGGPQDVEWALDRGGAFHLLQARPITTHASLPRGSGTLWTRRFVGERWPDGATPLGWSLVAPILEHFIAYPETAARFLGGAPALARVGGHPYVNVTVFRHLAFKLPGAPPPRFLLDFFPPDEEAAWLRRAAAAPDLRVYGSILRETARERRWERFRWNPLTNPRSWDAFAADLDARIHALDRAAPADALRIATPIVRDYVKIHVTSLLYANLAWELLAPRLGPRVSEVVLRPPAGSVTVRINAALHAVGRARGAEQDALLAQLLAEHGHRASASWEVWSRRWVEDPAGVRALATLAAASPDPLARAVSADRAAEARIEELSPRMRRAVRLARDYLRLREEQRWHLDRVLWALKQKLRELGAAWFGDPDDVRFLEVSEVEAGAEDRLTLLELRERATRRRAEPVEAHPADFLDGSAVAAGRAARADRGDPSRRSGNGRVQGLGISPGLVRGRARVLRSLSDGALLEPGDILVARATDPSWTPLFARAGGLVLELGSVLSHGAVVAREYRLPGVVNVADATHLFQDGEELTVDGTAGVVWRHG